jgi:hypothetical protein
MRHIIPISGKDSLATALLQTAHRPDLPYEFVFNDTGCELPETYGWLAQVEQKTGWGIARIGESLEAKIRSYNGFLPGPRSRYCTIETKIEPFEACLGGDRATVYYGLRADERRTGYIPFAGSSITPAYPLRRKDEGGIAPNGFDLQAVYAILEARDLLPPDFFCPDLYKAVSDRLHDVEWEAQLTRWQRRSLFSWRSRGNCYMCFYQQQFELLGLLKYHPDYFWRMASFEKRHADQPEAKRQKRSPSAQQLALIDTPVAPPDWAYTWRSEYSLESFAGDRAMQDRIFAKRVDQVVKQILEILSARTFGAAINFEIADDMADTSCGLICGK